MNQQKAIKYSGAGNLIILVLEEKRNPDEKQALAKKLCHLQTGLGADGVLYLKENKSPAADYLWDFYNTDGSTAEMCGNAARCAGQFCFEELGFVKNKIIFQTLAGSVSCEKKSQNQFEVEMSAAKIINPQMELEAAGKTETFFFVDTGVPHLVFEMPENVFDFRDSVPMKAWAKSFRDHPNSGANGTNVTLVNSAEGIKKAITFERGVENFTSACGTGAVAAAMYFENKMPLGFHKISMPGGVLEVDLKTYSQPHLIGPSEKISEMYIEEM